LHRKLIDDNSIDDQYNASIDEKIVYLVNDSQENFTLSQIISKSSMSHRIKCSRHVHVQKRDHLVVTLISNDVYLLRKKFQS
jgi:hypothetical protein